MKKYLIFFLFLLAGLSKDSFCMESQLENKEKKQYKSRGEQAFFEMLAVYKSLDEMERKKKLEIASKHIWDTCFIFAKEKKDELGSVSSYGVGSIIAFDFVEKNQDFFKEKVFKLLERSFAFEQDMGIQNGKAKLFEEKVSEIEEKLAKDILCLGAYIAVENKKEFKEMLAKSLTWGFGWLKHIIFPLLSNSIEFIETEIDDKVKGNLVLKEKEDSYENKD